MTTATPGASPLPLAPALTPHGRLLLAREREAPALNPALAVRLEEAFAGGAGHGLLHLGAAEVGTRLEPTFSYWRELGARYVTALCTLPADGVGAVTRPAPPLPPTEELQALAAAAPPMVGAEYLTAEVLAALWGEMTEALHRELAESKASLQDFLKRLNPAWNLVGRVHFHLAENRQDKDSPFAFLATYTTRLSALAQAQHVPLGQALKEYAGAANKDRLLALLVPVQRAAASCDWLKVMVDAEEIFHPLRWTPAEATRFLRDVHRLESAGVLVRLPANWKAGRPSRPVVTATVGGKPPVGLGRDALLDFSVALTLDGEDLTAVEVKALLAGSEGLALIRGRWVEVNKDRLQRTLDLFQQAERAARGTGMSFAEAMRALAGADATPGDDSAAPDADWSQVVAGPWLKQTLSGLRSPEALARVTPGRELKGTLRPYQEVGVRWLHLLQELGLGACLADDMGLGKTVQVLSLLLVRKRLASGENGTCLLVAPASLLANWAAEIERFAPSLKALVAHPSAMPAAELKALHGARLAGVDLVITSYATLLRLPALTEHTWQLAILDEAQAIKNPGAKQTRAVKSLHSRCRIALTGTPIENRLGDLWSIFDFINPGLLGSAKEFTALVKRLGKREHNPWAPLRELVRPYILRRLKTDKAVIDDLPDKTEVTAWCPLSKKQAALYSEAVEQLRATLEDGIDGMRRKGVVLAFLMRFKQICNHPSQWLGDGAWEEPQSGKWGRLRDIAEVIAAKQEKMLVFTQFREVTAPLASFLGSIFGKSGLVLHGETLVKKRADLVQRFQNDDDVPFFVLSLKAGGAGLNLTAASHVVHFDRWWNPAVENQATDRAFRIGQRRNVLVHKFVCRGTIEEKIDELMAAKRKLAGNLLDGGGGELTLTEMKDDELLDLVALDIHAAMKES